MNNKSSKFPIVLFLSIDAIVFIPFLILQILLSSSGSNLLVSLISIFLISTLAAYLISLGLTSILPVMSELSASQKKLFRFENLSHPLLLRLSYEAPGTFHHSINVSILAQKAAKSIGADTLLIRAGAYYHDIGKLEAPLRYVENQSGEEIPKDEDIDSIKRSARDIISHVKSGIEIADKYHLPKEIISLIEEHHGTTKVLYFYEKAKEKGIRIKKTDFKYPGPAPQSREAAILMLADGVEAATRAVPGLTREKITEIVENTIADKILEKQFKFASFSNKHLVLIKNSLVETLLSIYHERIKSLANDQN